MDLAHVKDLKLSQDINSFSEDIRVSAQKHFQGVIEPRALRLVYGSTLAENRILRYHSYITLAFFFLGRGGVKMSILTYFQCCIGGRVKELQFVFITFNLTFLARVNKNFKNTSSFFLF